MAIFGKRKHAVLRYNPALKNIEFVCKDDGTILWLGAMYDVYKFMSSRQVKKNKYVYAVNDEQYLGIKTILQHAAEGVNMVSGPEDCLFDKEHMTRISFNDYTSCVAFPSLNYYQRKLKNNPDDHKLRGFVNFVMQEETVYCKSCGQIVVSPSAKQLSDKLADNPGLQRVMDTIYETGAYCVPCAALMLCEVASFRLQKHGDLDSRTVSVMESARDIVLDEDQDMTKATPLLVELAGLLGGVGVSKIKMENIQPWMK